MPPSIPEQYRQRPTVYCAQTADLVIVRLENGESLTKVCEDVDYPLAGTFLRWVSDDPGLRTRYEAAREMRSHLLIDSIIDAGNMSDPQRGRLRLDALRTVAEKTAPTVYGRGRGDTPPAADGRPLVDHVAELRQKIESMPRSA